MASQTGKTPEPMQQMKSENQEKFEKGKMVVSFRYFDSKETEASKLFFEVNGVQVVSYQYDYEKITHVIYKRFSYWNDSFGDIVSGRCVLNHSYVKTCMKANKILTNFSDFELKSANLHISDELAAIVGVKVALESVVGKKLGAYIKENELHGKTGYYFRCDEKLETIFGSEGFQFVMSEILKHLYNSKHLLYERF